MRIPRAYHPAGTLALMVVVTSVGFNGCSPPAQPAPPAAKTTLEVPGTGTTVAARLTAVSALIARRLDLMPGVAQAKWNRKLPITDEKREQALLTRLAAEGEGLDLPAAFVSEFFQAQITAAKLIQERAFEEWKSQQQPPFANPPDLEKDVRPQIDEINQLLLKELADVWKARTSPDWTTAVDQANRTAFDLPRSRWPDDVVAAATKPLRDASPRK